VVFSSIFALSVRHSSVYLGAQYSGNLCDHMKLFGVLTISGEAKWINLISAQRFLTPFGSKSVKLIESNAEVVSIFL
jgi:hypothetical protein